MSELVDTATVLALKIDKFSTKLFLFDVVDEKYHLIATSETASTAFSPFHDIREGFVRAIEKLQEITGRELIDSEANLIIPSTADGSGIDHLAVTYGFNHKTKAIVMGLLENVSLESATRSITMTQIDLVDRIGMNDNRKIDELMSVFSNKQPDIVLLTGGTENGATRSLAKLLDVLMYSLLMLPKNQKPDIVFAGNSQIAEKIKNSLKETARVHITQNIRPEIEFENLNPTKTRLNKISTYQIIKKIGGFQDLTSHCKSSPIPYSQAAETMVNFLSRINEKATSVLFLDLNQEFHLFSAAANSRIGISTINYSMSSNFDIFLKSIQINEIKKWLQFEIEDEEISAYLWNRKILPGFIPLNEREMSIEYAILKSMLQKQFADFLSQWNFPRSFNQIIISGDYIASRIKPKDTIQFVLDGIQPAGVANLFLDQHGILPALGAIAVDNQFLPVQIMETSAITQLAKLLTLSSNAKINTAIVELTIEYEDGSQTEMVIRKGDLVQLPILAGQQARISIDPLKRLQKSLNSSMLEKGIIVQGGLNGVIIDARGRPIVFPKDHATRQNLLNQWKKLSA